MQDRAEYPFDNRAATYGDGCFTTMAVHGGEVELLACHLQRLKANSAALALTLESELWLNLESEIRSLAQAKQNGIIKVLLSAGRGGRGYLRSQQTKVEFYLQTLDEISHYSLWRKQGITLGVASYRLHKHSTLAGFKHLNRLEQVLVKQTKSAHQDDLVLDTDGMIVEVSAGNVFWRQYQRWFTSSLNKCGVEGVMRNHIISQMWQQGIPVHEVRIGPDDLRSASDVFVCNSLMKLVPVNQLVLDDSETMHFDNVNIGQITSQLSKTVLL